MTRINKEIRKHFDNCGQIRFLLNEALITKEELEERIQFLQEKLEEESSKIISLEKEVNPKITVKEFLEKHYRKDEGSWYSGTCHCEGCTCDIKGFKKCENKAGCRAKYLERKRPPKNG
jgi:hypothetical protein